MRKNLQKVLKPTIISQFFVNSLFPIVFKIPYFLRDADFGIFKVP